MSRAPAHWRAPLLPSVRSDRHYKSLQSGELGIGFALTLAEHLLRSRFPDHTVTMVPADTALRAGWPLTSRDKGEKVKYRYLPQYFAEVWRPGEPSLTIPLACKGNHGDTATSAEQLASASAHAEAVHIGPWNETPSLLFSTQLPTGGGTMTVHALQAPGSGGRLHLRRGLGRPRLRASRRFGSRPASAAGTGRGASSCPWTIRVRRSITSGNAVRLNSAAYVSLQEGYDGRGKKIPQIGDLNVGGMGRGELGDGHARWAEDGGEGPQRPWAAVQGPGRC